MMKYNIEFAHIYADKEFGPEQESSIAVLKTVIARMKEPFVTCILVDELSSQKNSLDVDLYIEKIGSFDVPVDVVAFESKLGPVAEKVIELIPNQYIKREREVVMLEKDNQKIGLKEKSGKYSCSLLIAAWTLCRLGILSLPRDATQIKSKNFEAEKLITILPEKYRKTEDKVLDILKSTNYKDVVGKIEYQFF